MHCIRFAIDPPRWRWVLRENKWPTFMRLLVIMDLAVSFADSCKCLFDSWPVIFHWIENRHIVSEWLYVINTFKWCLRMFTQFHWSKLSHSPHYQSLWFIAVTPPPPNQYQINEWKSCRGLPCVLQSHGSCQVNMVTHLRKRLYPIKNRWWGGKHVRKVTFMLCIFT